MVVENNLYTYTCWGLEIGSELECPLLPKGSGNPDVLIHLGKTPEDLAAAKVTGACFAMNEREFLFKVDGVAKYFVQDRRKIVVEPFPGAEPNEIRLFLLGPVFGALLHQRGIPPFHGSGVGINGRAVVLVGPSGAGKSTLAAELCRRGHGLLTDDVCALRLREGAPPLVLPAYPQTKLWSDALDVLDVDQEGLRRLLAQKEKFAFPLEASFCGHSIPLAAVCILSSHDGETIDLEPLTGQEKFVALSDNTYGLSLLEGMGDKSAHFRACAAMARYASVARIRRPREPFLLRELADRIERLCLP